MKNLLVLLAVSFFVSASYAEHGEGCHHKDMSKMTKEDREKMASVHEKHAACLRSDKSAEDCHKEMMSAHDEMGMGCGMKHDKKHGKMKKEDKKEETKK